MVLQCISLNRTAFVPAKNRPINRFDRLSHCSADAKSKQISQEEPEDNEDDDGVKEVTAPPTAAVTSSAFKTVKEFLRTREGFREHGIPSQFELLLQKQISCSYKQATIDRFLADYPIFFYLINFESVRGPWPFNLWPNKRYSLYTCM